MPFNNGVYTPPTIYRATPGELIRAEQHNVPIEDIAQALTGSVRRDGTSSMLANLPMGGRKITGLGEPTAGSDGATKSYVDGKVIPAASTTVSGIVELATTAETVAGTGNTRATTPEGVNAAITAFMPPGAVMPFYRGTAPSGWLICNAAQVSRTTYAALWQAMGSPNTGNGTTTFTLPDLRGEFIRGLDDGRGIDTGRTIGSSQGQAIQEHKHDILMAKSRDAGPVGGEYQRVGYSNNENLGTGTNPVQNTGGPETRPRNVALLYCIKT